jgi:hypothetical protein
VLGEVISLRTGFSLKGQNLFYSVNNKEILAERLIYPSAKSSLKKYQHVANVSDFAQFQNPHQIKFTNNNNNTYTITS